MGDFFVQIWCNISFWNILDKILLYLYNHQITSPTLRSLLRNCTAVTPEGAFFLMCKLLFFSFPVPLLSLTAPCHTPKCYAAAAIGLLLIVVIAPCQTPTCYVRGNVVDYSCRQSEVWYSELIYFSRSLTRSLSVNILSWDESPTERPLSRNCTANKPTRGFLFLSIFFKSPKHSFVAFLF